MTFGMFKKLWFLFAILHMKIKKINARFNRISSVILVRSNLDFHTILSMKNRIPSKRFGTQLTGYSRFNNRQQTDIFWKNSKILPIWFFDRKIRPPHTHTQRTVCVWRTSPEPIQKVKTCFNLPLLDVNQNDAGRNDAAWWTQSDTEKVRIWTPGEFWLVFLYDEISDLG